MSPRLRFARIQAQAKLNLALRVLGRDDSGYHPLETLFIRIDLADSLVVKPTENSKSISAPVSLGPPEENLAFRAAKAYSVVTGWPAGWDIQVEKNIPVGAGLGGGSADAGAVLRSLNALSPNPLTPPDLWAIAAGLGADVAFMATDYAFAFAEGYGEKLTPLEAPQPRAVALAIPAFSVSTRDAYSWFDTDGAARADRARWDLKGLSWPAIERGIENDFTGVISSRHKEIGQLVEWMHSRGARAAGMTGSGSVVFGIFDSKPAGRGFSLPVEGKLVWTRTSGRVVEPQLIG